MRLLKYERRNKSVFTSLTATHEQFILTIEKKYFFGLFTRESKMYQEVPFGQIDAHELYWESIIGKDF